VQEHEGPITAGLTGACRTETGSVWPCPQANSLSCCHDPALLPCDAVPPRDTMPSPRRLAVRGRPKGTISSLVLSSLQPGARKPSSAGVNPKPCSPAPSFLPAMELYPKGMKVTSSPRNEQAEDARRSEAAGSESPRHGADGAGRSVRHRLCSGASDGALHGADVPTAVTSPGEHLAAVRPPPRVPVISPGFASAVMELWRRCRARGDSAREPLPQPSQASFQPLCALLRGRPAASSAPWKAVAGSLEQRARGGWAPANGAHRKMKEGQPPAVAHGLLSAAPRK